MILTALDILAVLLVDTTVVAGGVAAVTFMARRDLRPARSGLASRVDLDSLRARLLDVERSADAARAAADAAVAELRGLKSAAVALGKRSSHPSFPEGGE